MTTREKLEAALGACGAEVSVDIGKPKIFVFCNSCAPEWHNAMAIDEQGNGITAHICSSHAFIPHDMGITSEWHHDAYRKHFPDGYELVLIQPLDDPMKHDEFRAAVERGRS